MYWYRIDVDHIDKVYAFIGSSPLAPPDLAQTLQGEGYIHLTNLVYRDSQRRFKSWQEWEPLFKEEMWINPKHVLSFQELTAKPETE